MKKEKKKEIVSVREKAFWDGCVLKELTRFSNRRGKNSYSAR